MTTQLSTIPKSSAAPPASVETAPEPTTDTAETQTSTAAPVTETPEVPEARKPAPEVDPDLELSRKFESVAKREARARRHESELQSKLTSLSTKEKELEATIAEYKAALEDPVEHYLKKGKDPLEMAKRISRPVSEEEKRLARIEERLAKDEEEREKVRQENETRAQTQRRHTVMRRFVEETGPDEYPHLTSVYEPEQVPRLIHDLLNGPQDPTDPDSPTLLQAFKSRHRRSPTDKEIRDALEHKAETYAMSLIERLPKRQVAKSQVTPETPPATEESTSLSNQHASSSASTRSRTKSRDEVMKELKAELEAEGGE